jgi:hypothetical protein
MAAPALGHLICSMALVALILVMPSFFAMERNSIAEEMALRELTEIADYTSSTLENLFLLANSTNSRELTITKDLFYLPTKVDGSPYVLEISSVDDVTASQVTAYLTDRSWVKGTSWLVPDLKITSQNSITISDYTVEVGCKRDATGFYVWIGKGE